LGIICLVLPELHADQLLALRKRNGLVAVFECERIHAYCLTLVERLHGKLWRHSPFRHCKLSGITA
jgi:hypothetical protein